MTCIHGHDAGRDSSGHCKVCRNEYKKAYYRKFKGVRRAQRRRNRVSARRRAEITSAKAVLMSAHRLRAIGVKKMNWMAYQRSPNGRTLVLFDERPNRDWDMCSQVMWDTVQPIPVHLKAASLREIADWLGTQTIGFGF